MKFDMGQTTLSTLTKQTSSSNQDLGSLVKRLAAAAEPLENKFNGAGRQAFDAFKMHTDEISASLNSALTSILGGVAGMDSSFTHGDSDMADSTKSVMGSANFDAARFGSH